MSKQQQTGKTGETLAISYLQQQGFIVLHQNWRHRRYEVDIIASKQETVHFIEVKTRTNKTYGNPEESVTTKKINNLLKAANAFQQQHPQWQRIQLDVLSILMEPTGEATYFFIEDVYL